MGLDDKLMKMEIKDNVTGNIYIASYIQRRNIGQEKPVTSLQLPGKQATNNKLLALQGMVREINLKFLLVNDGQDKSNGTAPSDGTFTNDTVTTVEDQEYWLYEYLHSPDFQVDWTIQNTDFRVLEGSTVHLETIDTQVEITNHGVFRTCDMKLIVGSTI